MMKPTAWIMGASLLGILGIAGCASSSPEPGGEATTPQDAPAAAAARDQAALSSLETLRQVVENQKTVGPAAPPSAAELDGARIGEGVPMRMVRLDALRAYRTGDDPRGLLVDRGAYLYPVTVDGDARRSVVMVQQEGDMGRQWQPTRFGGPSLVKVLHATRRDLAAAKPLRNVMLVEVPALHAKFMAHDDKGELLLTPLQDVDDTKLRIGHTEKAADVFAALVPIALQVDLNPPQ